MGKIYGYNEGDRSELYCQCVLAAFGHIIPVPRQFDHFGVDLLVHLTSQEPRVLLSTGSIVAVQVKSDEKPIVVDGVDQITALHRMPLPFWIACVDKASGGISIFPTTERISYSWSNPDNPVVFQFPGHSAASVPAGALPIQLAGPMVRISRADVDDPEQQRRNDIRAVMWAWALVEQMSLAWRISGVPVCPALTVSLDSLPDPVNCDYYVDTAPQNFERFHAWLDLMVMVVEGYLEKLGDHLSNDGDKLGISSRVNRLREVSRTFARELDSSGPPSGG